MDADAVPTGRLVVELSVRRTACIVLGEELNLPVSNARVLKLHAGQDRPVDFPIHPFVALKIRIGDRPDLAAPIRARTGEFHTPLSRRPAQVVGLAMYDDTTAAIHTQPGEDVIGEFDVQLFIA